MSKVDVWMPFPEGEGPDDWPKRYVSEADYIALRAEVERLKSDIRDARGLMRGMIDAKDGRVARFLIERAERFIERAAGNKEESRNA